MTFDEYQQAAKTTAIYPREHAVTYPALGLAGEAGELCNKIKKMLRDDGGVLTQSRSDEIRDELGDVLWYVSGLASDAGLTLEDIARNNLEKLASRKARGTLGGSGDKR